MGFHRQPEQEGRRRWGVSRGRNTLPQHHTEQGEPEAPPPPQHSGTLGKQPRAPQAQHWDQKALTGPQGGSQAAAHPQKQGPFPGPLRQAPLPSSWREAEARRTRRTSPLCSERKGFIKSACYFSASPICQRSTPRAGQRGAGREQQEPICRRDRGCAGGGTRNGGTRQGGAGGDVGTEGLRALGRGRRKGEV